MHTIVQRPPPFPLNFSELFADCRGRRNEHGSRWRRPAARRPDWSFRRPSSDFRPFVRSQFTTSQPLCLAFVNLSDEDDECNGELTRPGIERYMWLNVARCWYKGNLITSEAPDWAKHHCQASPRWGHTINHHQLTYFEFTWDEAIIITWSKKTILRVISLQMYPRWYGTSFCTVSFSNGSHAVVGQEQEDERSLMINAFMELPSEEMLQIARSFKWG